MTAVLTPTPGVAYREDTYLWPVLEQLADCLCVELAESNLPDLCFCGLLAGEAPADQMGEGAEGQAWVRLVRVYPSAAFPQQAVDPGRTCAAPLAAEVEVGVMRCAPMPSDNGTVPPSASDWWEAARLQTADMMAMRRAIRCCGNGSELVSLGAWTPSGPQGGILGGTWQVFLSGSTGR